MKKLSLLILGLLLVLLTAQAQDEIYRPNAPRTVERIRWKLPFETQETEVEVQVVDGIAVFEGDIVLGPIEELRSDGRGGAMSTSLSTRWDMGIIPYEIQADHPHEATIRRGIEYINQNTNLRMQNRNGEADYVEFIFINEEEGCWSDALGRKGGRQRIHIVSWAGRGTVVHEIGHAAGLYHEHTRADRDSFITVNFNIIDGDDWKSQYRRYTQRADYAQLGGLDIGAYDFGSIMHYSDGRNSSFNTSPGTPIITPRRTGVTFGQRDTLSRTDIATLNLINLLGIFAPDNSAQGPARDEGGRGGRVSANRIDVVYNDVQLVPQTAEMGCWAAGASMLVGWRDLVSIDPTEVANAVGMWANYHRPASQGGGLPPEDTTMFRYWGLVPAAPMTYTVQGFAQMLDRYGPLWVASAVPGAHIRVVTGMTGDGTADGTVLTIYDPWQRGMRRFRMPNPGSIYTETYTEFVRKQSELADRELTRFPNAIYIAHNPDR